MHAVRGAVLVSRCLQVLNPTATRSSRVLAMSKKREVPLDLDSGDEAVCPKEAGSLTAGRKPQKRHRENSDGSEGGEQGAPSTAVAASTSASTPSGAGKVVIAVKPPRGSGQPFPSLPGFTRIDVTSGSCNRVLQPRDVAATFSPMAIGPVKGARLFENYWQYGKVFQELGHLRGDGTPEGSSVTDKWRQFRAKGYAKAKGCRRPPEAKTTDVLEVREGRRKFRYLIPRFAHYDGKNMGYITSRKQVYVPEYARLVEETRVFKALRERVLAGENVMILDLDGPRDQPGGVEVTVEMLRTRINDPRYQFGHGYVAAALLAGIEPEQYCMA
eukprot:m.237485 g.237485  ORF g.237485 m.237485 type:complete len:329 (-) comp18954_c0_seq2:68-1054(-)